jgi:hypothetical protein
MVKSRRTVHVHAVKSKALLRYEDEKMKMCQFVTHKVEVTTCSAA